MKGILFQPWKIRAIAANPDKEWQTRRLMNPQPKLIVSDEMFKENLRKCNYLGSRYKVGEVVYIKEGLKRIPKFYVEYTGYHTEALYSLDGHFVDGLTWCWKKDWLSPLYLPEGCARYFIKITKVEACRTKDISFDDCLAEGVVDSPFWQNLDYKAPAPLHPDNLSNAEADKEIDRGWIAYAQQAYFALYDSINGKGAHERNWDWKYSFKKFHISAEKER